MSPTLYTHHLSEKLKAFISKIKHFKEEPFKVYYIDSYNFDIAHSKKREFWSIVNVM